MSVGTIRIYPFDGCRSDMSERKLLFLYVRNEDVLLFQIISYSGYAVMAFLTSFVISLAFEAPVVRLLKIISGGTPKNKSH